MSESNNEIKYFDKRIEEEDKPIEVSDEKQEKYERLDTFFEKIFDENSLNVAKVIIFNFIFLIFVNFFIFYLAIF